MDYLNGMYLTGGHDCIALTSEDIQNHISHLSYFSTLYNFAMRAKTLFTSVVDEVSTSTPSLTSLVLLVILLFFSMKLLGVLWRGIVFWVSLAIKAVIGISLAFLAFWVISRGPEGFVEDVQYFAEYWTGEYNRYSDKTEFVKQWAPGFSQPPRKTQKRRW
jgi:hypothetical protein